VPKGKAAAPVANDGKVGPSSLEGRRALLERLHMTEHSMEVRCSGRLVPARGLGGSPG
jgi:hypothetical protein